jgi:hypothetical protein
MKSRIVAAFGEEKLEHRENITYPQIHIADHTRRTGGEHAIEIYDALPKGIDTLVVENPGLDISATFFKPQCFRDEHGKEPDNCEGVFYLTFPTDKTWILFFEIKDCKPTNISHYFIKTKEQVKTVVQIFRDREIIASKNDKRVYANISFPRRNKVDFFSQLIKPGEAKEWLDRYGIFIRGTNCLTVKNDTTIF